VFSLLLFAPFPAFTQEQNGNVILQSSEQLFDVLAALEASGYNTGADIDTGDNTRNEVRAYLARQNIPVRTEISKFYTDHVIPDNPGQDLGQYVSLALLLDAPPDFKLTLRMRDLPPDARAVVGLVPLVKTFYRQADLADLWARLAPRYERARSRYRDEVRHDIELSDGYLRFPSGSYLGRTYTIDIALLGAPEQVQARIYRDSYYLVLTPSRTFKLDKIRYQYLHFLLDPLAVKFASDIEQKAELQGIARTAPALGDDYKNDFSLFVTECLIRAVELRMDKPKDAEKQVKHDLAEGLILTPYFYTRLADYEQQQVGMSIFYKDMVDGIPVRKIEQELADYKFAPPEQPKTVKRTVVLSQRDQLLQQGDNLIYQGQYLQAEADFRQVLQKFDPKSAEALYGMAVAAANTRKPDIAEKYFKQTLAVARNIRIVTWSHIYLGRIYDLESRRSEALEQYREASVTAANFPDALRAVQAGLRLPYGVK
jgi:tetratricopeptide (TPR) repeat protein